MILSLSLSLTRARVAPARRPVCSDARSPSLRLSSPASHLLSHHRIRRPSEVVREAQGRRLGRVGISLQPVRRGGARENEILSIRSRLPGGLGLLGLAPAEHQPWPAPGCARKSVLKLLHSGSQNRFQICLKLFPEPLPRPMMTYMPMVAMVVMIDG